MTKKLEKIIKFVPIRDGDCRYISYCDFGWHQGYVKSPSVCETRKCKYYYRLYIPPKPKDI